MAFDTLEQAESQLRNGTTCLEKSEPTKDDLDKAAMAFARALSLCAEHPDALVGLGNIAVAQGKHRAALSFFKRTLAVDDSHQDAAAGAGRMLTLLGKYDEAETIFREHSEQENATPDLLVGYGKLLADTGEYDKAISVLQRAMDASPAHEQARAELARAHLLAGELKRGFKLLSSSTPLLGMSQCMQRWTGSGSSGKGLVVYQDCDDAEALVLIRYLKLLPRKGVDIGLSLSPRMQSLVTLLGLKTTPVTECAEYATLREVAAAVSQDHVYEPTGPYVSFPAGMTTSSEGLRIGLCWNEESVQGTRLHPFANPDCLLELFSVPGVMLTTFFDTAIMQENIAAQLLLPQPPLETARLDELARGLGKVDCVVGPDCPAVRLAAAMGRDVRVLLPHGADWVYPANGAVSPWFSSMRLYRTEETGPQAGERFVRMVRDDFFAEWENSQKMEKVRKKNQEHPFG